MMRGIRTWAVAVRKPSAEQLATHREGLDPEEAAEGEIEVVTEPLQSLLRRHRVYRLPIIRGVIALGESLKIGFRALGISANAQLPDEEEEISGGMWAGTIVVSILLAVGLFFLIPVGLTSLIKDQLNSLVPLLARRGPDPHGDLPRLPAAAQPPAGPPPRVRVPRRRAQDDLLLRGRHGAHPGERRALLAPPSALRDDVPAARDGRGDLRLRPDRVARLVLAAPHAHRRRAPDRRHLLRADQAAADIGTAAGSAPSCGPASSSSTSPPENPTAPSSPSRSPRSTPYSRRARPPRHRRQDLIGVEVVA